MSAFLKSLFTVLEQRRNSTRPFGAFQDHFRAHCVSETIGVLLLSSVDIILTKKYFVKLFQNKNKPKNQFDRTKNTFVLMENSVKILDLKI